MTTNSGKSPSPNGWYTPTELRDAAWRFAVDRRILLQAGLVGACILLFLANVSNSWISVIDDAFITFRFSRNIAGGHGIVFNPGGPWVEGYTNFTWMILAIPPIAWGWDVVLTMKLAGILCSVGTLLASWRLTASLRGAEDPLNVLPAVCLAVNAHFGFWTVQAMETPFQVILVVATYHFFLREMHDPRRWPAGAILAALAMMTRLDSAVFLFPLGVWAVWAVVRREVALKRLLVWGAIAMGLFAVYFSWKVVAFGDFYPNTYYAKVDGEFINRPRGVAHLFEFYFNQAGWERPRAENAVTFLGDVLLGKRLNGIAWMNLWMGTVIVLTILGRSRERILLIGPLLLQAWYILKIGGDWMPGFRFFQSMIPFLGIGLAIAVDRLMDLAGGRKGSRLAVRIGIGLLFVIASFEQMRIDTAYVFGPDPLWFPRQADWHQLDTIHSRYTGGFSPPLAEVANAIALNTIDNASILMSDIGQPAWFRPDLRIIDVDGLTDKVIADAPSVRSHEYGGIGIESLAGIENNLRAVRADWSDSAIAAEARRLHRERVMQRAVNYVMEVERPAYILAFEQHQGAGPDSPGYVYPDLVRLATEHPDFENYREVWRGIKTGNDVWNHLYTRDDVDHAISPSLRVERFQRIVRENPRLRGTVEKLYEELAELPDEERGGALATVYRHLARFTGDEGFVRRMLYLAGLQEDAATAREILDAAIVRGFDDEPWLYRMTARVYQDRGEYEEAVSILETGVENSNPADNSLLYDLAYIYEFPLSDADRALEATRRAIRRNEKEERAWDTLAGIAERTGDYSSAAEALEGMIATRPVDEVPDAWRKRLERLRALADPPQ